MREGSEGTKEGKKRQKRGNIEKRKERGPEVLEVAGKIKR